MNKLAAAIGGFCLVLLCLVAISPKPITPTPPPLPNQVDPVSPVPPQQQFPAKPNITNAFPGYQDYSGVVAQLEQWKAQAPGLVETGTYGQSKRGAKLNYIRVTNLLDPTPKKKVLITACIHGNEPLSASTTMAFIGTMLSTYGSDTEVTQLINERDIYFVPVISPDSYPNSRHVDGVDPNRDFPGPSNPGKQSVPPVKAIQTFFLQHRFNAVISGHTFGRVYLIPYGDRTELSPNNADFQRVIGQMSGLSKYRIQRACEMYSRPIFGTEVDWYYRNGAFSSTQNGKKIHRGAFSIVCEFGTHQNIPSMGDIREEFNRTYKAFLYFCQEAPLVEIWWDEAGNPVNADGTPKNRQSQLYLGYETAFKMGWTQEPLGRYNRIFDAEIFQPLLRTFPWKWSYFPPSYERKTSLQIHPQRHQPSLDYNVDFNSERCKQSLLSTKSPETTVRTIK